MTAVSLVHVVTAWICTVTAAETNCHSKDSYRDCLHRVDLDRYGCDSMIHTLTALVDLICDSGDSFYSIDLILYMVRIEVRFGLKACR